VIRSQRSPYGTSLLGAGAVHHIRLGHRGKSALSPFYPQLRTFVGAAGTAGKENGLNIALPPRPSLILCGNDQAGCETTSHWHCAHGVDQRIVADEQVPAVLSQSNVRANQFPRSVNRAEPIR
jgi:hypothetical protein